ncbi:DUF4166 domain-containing protein [Woodsholea maritima]|uniref:DUF4166 domain-containing protein n=1 Tax=Woodsholea maritima TaxID=240237 RepID=UPI000362BCC4|nr:DUF4166 domain-containing protein [Woodsholea maritima]
MSPLYAQVLGAAWEDIPAITRHLHSPDPIVTFAGEVEVRRGTSPLTRILAQTMGLPQAGHHRARITVSRGDDGDEILERRYGETILTTRQYLITRGKKQFLGEAFGPFRLRFDLCGHGAGIDFMLSSVKAWSIPLPRAMALSVKASERVGEGQEGQARHCFDVEVSLPGLGRLIAYQGWLESLSA